MYNNIHPSEFSDKFAEFGPSHPFRTTTSFNSAFSAPNNAGRARQGSLPVTSSGAHTFRDTSNFSQHYAVDVFATAQPNIQSISSPQSQSHQQQSNPGGNTFDSMQPPRGFEFGPGSQQMPSGVIGSAHPKFTNVDPFSAGAGASLLSTHKPGAGQSQNQGLQTLGGYQQGQYLNGMSHQSQNMRSQTPYGPHLPASASAPVLSQGQSPSGHTNPNGAPQQSAQEEISTIFVVGFPEDMQEREFQNMFTFSQGFEAATLKIPNKELTAYGSGTRSAGPGSGPLGYMQTHGGPNDPYNLVTINQGGIVVDSARDGTTSSWQNPSLDAESHLASNQNPNISTRKQIIGFAKFRTRKEALEARDTLQGRRVDLEKGAVLKAEMAKKNLHTKRGIGIGAGPLGAQVGGIAGMMGSGGGLPGEASLAGLQGMGGMQINGMHGLGMGPSGAEALTQREKELGTLGAMGFAGLGMNGRKEGQDERAFGSTGARGARERAEEEERKSRVDVERERSARLRSSNAYAFDAFHSVPPSSQAVGNSLLAATAGTTEANLSSSQSDPASRVFTSHGNIASPWGMGGGRDNGAALNNAYRKMSAAAPGSTLPPRPTSPFGQRTSQQSSPPNREANAFGPPPGLSAAGFSPPSQANSLPAHPSLPSRPRAYSPTGGSASASSVGDSVSVGEREASDEEMSRGMQSLAVSTQSIGGSGTTDLTSPQLPSPASAGSKSGSGSGSSAVDQNPPINTLYVGNLPSSPSPPGMSPSYLEDSLRELFSRRPGFRKLCFRQKSNGPMCFVEFCDVQYATKALNDLYGATLNGLVKGGGIRLSYSKNPLGVRTPTSGQSQPQQAFSGETLQPRTLPELDMGNLRSRRDASGVTSPTASSPYQFSVSPPPPRFVSPPPGSFVASSFARASQSQGFGGYPQQSSLSNPPSSTSSSFSSFSPFGNSQSPHPSAFTPIPEQTSSATPIGNNTISNISDPASNCIGNPSNSSMQNTIHISNPTPIPDGSDQYSLQPLQ